MLPSTDISGSVTLSEKGLLTTSNEKGKVSIMAEDQDTELQIMMVNILITSIYSIFVEHSNKVYFLNYLN